MARGISGTKVANGNIAPSRIVKLDTTADGRVLQAAAATDKPYGISQPGTRNTPYGTLDDGNAAVAGENLMVYVSNAKDVLLEAGGPVTIGDALTSDASGRGVTTVTTGQWVIAEAMRTGVLGDLIPVWVLEPAQY